MTTITREATLPAHRVATNPLAPLATLVTRRFQLSVRTPRELVVPLLTPILFALVIAPALKQALHTSSEYEACVATGTIGLLIPLNTMFAGLSAIVDRESGAQRELLAAPIPRRLLVFGNLAVAFAITALQIGVLITLIAGVMYELSWEISMSQMSDDFIAQAFEHQFTEMKANGATDADIQLAREKNEQFLTYYRIFPIRFLITIMVELFPVGLVISIITAALLRKKEFLPATETV